MLVGHYTGCWLKHTTYIHTTTTYTSYIQPSHDHSTSTLETLNMSRHCQLLRYVALLLILEDLDICDYSSVVSLFTAAAELCQHL